MITAKLISSIDKDQIAWCTRCEQYRQQSTLKKACCGILHAFSGLIVAGTVHIWCTKRSGPYQYCCPTLASGHRPWSHCHWFVIWVSTCLYKETNPFMVFRPTFILTSHDLHYHARKVQSWKYSMLVHEYRLRKNIVRQRWWEKGGNKLVTPNTMHFNIFTSLSCLQ